MCPLLYVTVIDLVFVWRGFKQRPIMGKAENLSKKPSLMQPLFTVNELSHASSVNIGSKKLWQNISSHQMAWVNTAEMAFHTSQT